MDRARNDWLPVIQVECPACGSAEEAVVRPAAESHLGDVFSRFFHAHLGGGKELTIRATGRFVLPASG